MNSYSDDNQPRSGTGLKIYRRFKALGYKVEDLHYNPNAWGQNAVEGWGTWACRIVRPPDPRPLECWCGVEGNEVYLQAPVYPFTKRPLMDNAVNTTTENSHGLEDS